VTQPELTFHAVISGRSGVVEEAASATSESREAVLLATFVSSSSVFLAQKEFIPLD